MIPQYNYDRKRRNSSPLALERRQRILVGAMLLVGGLIVGFVLYLTLYYK